MKDDVKITVIATGFKTQNPERSDRAVSAAAAAISSARTASSFIPARPTFTPTAASPPQPGPPVSAQRNPAAPQRQATSLDAVKDTVKGNFEQDDLDVPAFIRKRGENG